jgi:hypothetical protein
MEWNGTETWGYNDKNSPDYKTRVCDNHDARKPGYLMPEVRYNEDKKLFGPLTREDVSMYPKDVADKLIQRSVGVAAKTNAELVPAAPKREVVPPPSANGLAPY